MLLAQMGVGDGDATVKEVDGHLPPWVVDKCLPLWLVTVRMIDHKKVTVGRGKPTFVARHAVVMSKTPHYIIVVPTAAVGCTREEHLGI